MNTESTERTVNFFLGSKEMKQLDNETATNKSEIYIIIQNDKLQSEVMTLREENGKLKNDYEVLETDSDKTEESVRYLRNLNKNLVVIREEESRVNEGYKFLHKATDAMNKKFSTLVTNMFYIMFMALSTLGVSLFAGVFGYGFGVMMFFTLGAISFGVSKIFLKFDKHTYKQLQKEYLNYKTSLTHKLKSITELERGIKKTEEGLPTIMEFIEIV
tara:strand:+ start:19138 stop:19785 length:648 start_codon:yes stop_codon:yes gene_type:complete